MIDKDFALPTPKEMARNLSEVMPTDEHTKEILKKIQYKLTDMKNPVDPYEKELKQEIINETFKDNPLVQLRNS